MTCVVSEGKLNQSAWYLILHNLQHHAKETIRRGSSLEPELKPSVLPAEATKLYEEVFSRQICCHMTAKVWCCYVASLYMLLNIEVCCAPRKWIMLSCINPTLAGACHRILAWTSCGSEHTWWCVLWLSSCCKPWGCPSRSGLGSKSQHPKQRQP